MVTRDFTVPMGRAGTDGRMHARLFPGPDTAPYDPTRLLAEAFRAFSVASVAILRDVTLASIRFTRQVDQVDAPLVGGAYQLSERDLYHVQMQLLVTKTQGGVGLPVDVGVVINYAYPFSSGSGTLQGQNVPSGSIATFVAQHTIPQGTPVGSTGTWTITVYLDGQLAKTFTIPLTVVQAPIEYGGLITLSRAYRG